MTVDMNLPSRLCRRSIAPDLCLGYGVL
jgi:hypothetical protein